MSGARRVNHCRLCRGPLTGPVLSLGDQPISNRLPRSADEPCPTYPLDISLCEDCGMVQLSHDLDAAEHFNDEYAYVSGASSTWTAHCRTYAQDLVRDHGLVAGDLVVEAGSNDGVLLRALAAEGLRPLGVEPSGNVAQIARKAGSETLTAFFGPKVVAAIHASHGKPKALIGNNVLAHVPDTNAFLTAARDLIAPDGFLCFEFPHVLGILERRYFDTIYHEHYAYLGVTPLIAWAARNGMEVHAVEAQPTHGGSLRVFLRHATGQALAPDVAAIAQQEARFSGAAPWRALSAWLEQWRDEVHALFADFKAKGRRVAGYAAASKATVLCNYLGLTAADIAYCCDGSSLKQDRFIPGTGIPIVAPERLKRDGADAVIVFAWNIFDEIAALVAGLAPQPVVLIRPLPELELIGETQRARA